LTAPNVSVEREVLIPVAINQHGWEEKGLGGRGLGEWTDMALYKKEKYGSYSIGLDKFDASLCLPFPGMCIFLRLLEPQTLLNTILHYVLVVRLHVCFSRFLSRLRVSQGHCRLVFHAL